jgi:hypothetical protein
VASGRWGGFVRCRVPACGFIRRCKCSGGPPVGCVVAVAASGYCGSLSSSASPCNRWASMYWCIDELSRVLRLVLLICGQVEGSLSARPSHYWRLQPELWFIMFFHPVRSAYQPPASSTFLSERTSHQQSAATSQQYSSLRTNQHQPSATSQPNRLFVDGPTLGGALGESLSRC